jgi:CMP-N-acetylneuraminic acid synthetase
VLHPPTFSTSAAGTYDVVAWNLERLAREGYDPDIIAILRATTPLRSREDINASVKLLWSRRDANSLVSVTKAHGIHPLRLKAIDTDGFITEPFGREGSYPIRRQELESYYIRNGAVYLARPFVIRAGGLWDDHCLAYDMPQDRSLNINTEFDLHVADLLFTARRASEAKT